MKQTIIFTAIILGLLTWNFLLQREVSLQAKYWQVMIDNSPKEVQDFFNAEVAKT